MYKGLQIKKKSWKEADAYGTNNQCDGGEGFL